MWTITTGYITKFRDIPFGSTPELEILYYRINYSMKSKLIYIYNISYMGGI
jgi:hypothetical protein